MTPTISCPSCGAKASGLICDHCGRLTTFVDSVADENRALDEFHNLIHKLARELSEEKEGREHEDEMFEKAAKAAQILRTGFIPDNKEVLLEAGVYCLQLMRGYFDIEDAALSRLESIVTKLKLMPQDQQVKLAVAEFECKIKELKEEKKNDNFYFLSCCGLAFILVLTIIILIIVRC
jgi:hypothetical protein